MVDPLTGVYAAVAQNEVIGARLAVEQINAALKAPAVTGASGGRSGGGAEVTAIGQDIIKIYRGIESAARKAAASEFRAVEKIVRKDKRKG